MNHITTAVECVLGMIGGAIFNVVLAQGIPENPIEWTNLSASVMLGGLSVYLVTRIIPAMHDKFNERLEKRDQTFNDALEKIHSGWSTAIDRICDKWPKRRLRKYEQRARIPMLRERDVFTGNKAAASY